MEIQKKLKSRARNDMVIASAAFQDHIIRSLLNPECLLSDPLSKCMRKAFRGYRERGRLVDQQRRDEEERDYVLDPDPPLLTLAQKLGLVASPAERLTEDEWTQVKMRSILQEESTKPCAICREEFRLQAQVLLSCSHVFHRKCLQAFERYSGRKSCPMCRTEHYETCVIHDAARLFRHHCATRIQAYWRGYVARKRHKNVQKINFTKDRKLRRTFFEERLQELNDCFVRYCQTDMEAFLADIDRSLSSSKRVFEQLERKGALEPLENEWERLKSQVIRRGIRDCPICLTAVCEPEPASEPARSSNQQVRHTVLLSCSHLFHQPCLEALEAFTADSRPTCPLCRSAYHKKVI